MSRRVRKIIKDFLSLWVEGKVKAEAEAKAKCETEAKATTLKLLKALLSCQKRHTRGVWRFQ